MPCSPSDNTFNIAPIGPPPGIPGLGLPFSVPKPIYPDVKIPDFIPEDIISLVQSIFAIFPAGITFKVNTDYNTKKIYDAVSKILDNLTPFLALYKFFQALLNIILCIINVICALLNPFSIPGAVSQLFSQCIPEFLSLFPWIALVVMVLSLFHLLMALIDYIITVVINYIDQITANIILLARAYQVSDTEGILATVKKISYLICALQNIFAILISFQAIIAIIKPLLSIAGGSVCGPSDSCCTDEFCPPFIRNNPDYIFAFTGTLLYLSQINADISSFPGFSSSNFTPVRPESWQFYDANSFNTYKFADIVTPTPTYGLTFWPEGKSYTNNANKNMVPYLADMMFSVNPQIFGLPDAGGIKKFNIRDTVVTTKPTTSVTTYNGGQSSPYTGTLQLGGGTVWQVKDIYQHSSTIPSDGYIPYIINGSQATLNTFIHYNQINYHEIPPFDDGYYINDVSYVFKWNFPILIKEQLTTVMCKPDVANEAAITNAEFSDRRNVLTKLGELPDLDTTISNINNCISNYRKSISEDTTVQLQTCLLDNLNNLRSQSKAFYSNGIVVAADRFNSDFSLTPEMQFVGEDIQVSVILRDKSGTSIAAGISSEFLTQAAASITTQASLGTVSSFTYDGYEKFVATLSSNEPGTGTLKAFLNGESFATVDRTSAPSKIYDKVLSYEFVGEPGLIRTPEEKYTFESDIANDAT